MSYENINKTKILELENKIKSLEINLSQHKFDKEYVKKDIDGFKGFIDRQDKRIEDVHSNLNYWAILFSFIGIFTGLAVFFINKKYVKEAKTEAKTEANKTVKEWIDINKEVILEPIKKEGNSLLSEIRKSADNLLFQK